jgi:large repetitive protein
VTAILQPAGSPTWSYANLQGHTTITADNSGTIISGPVTYDPWGNLNPGQTATTITTGPNALGAYASHGKLTNKATGTIALGARTFNPIEARFLSVDPIAGGCANPYTYAFGDPLTGSDLTGKAGCGGPCQPRATTVMASSTTVALSHCRPRPRRSSTISSINTRTPVQQP